MDLHAPALELLADHAVALGEHGALDRPVDKQQAQQLVQVELGAAEVELVGDRKDPQRLAGRRRERVGGDAASAESRATRGPPKGPAAPASTPMEPVPNGSAPALAVRGRGAATGAARLEPDQVDRRLPARDRCAGHRPADIRPWDGRTGGPAYCARRRSRPPPGRGRAPRDPSRECRQAVARASRSAARPASRRAVGVVAAPAGASTRPRSRAQAGAGEPARAPTRSTISPMIRLTSKSFGV